MVGWRHETLGEACQLVNGGTPKTKIVEYWDGPHAWVTPAEMGGRDSPYISNTRRRLSGAGLSKSSASMLPPYSVILSSRAPIGHLVINEVEMSTNQGCKGLIPGDGLRYKFLYYYLVSIVDLLNELGTGATFRELSATKLKAVPIPLPPLPEQDRIVAILDEAFAAIATATANTEKGTEDAREVLQHELNRLATSKLGIWPEKLLGEVCRLFQGLAINKGSKHLLVDKSPLPLLRIKDLRNGNSEQFVAESGYPPNARVGPEDIIYTRTGQIGLVFRGRSGVIHNNCFKITPFSGLDSDFLFWWLQAPAFRDHITRLASRAAQPDITHALFKEQLITLPSLSVQKASAARVERIKTHTDSLRLVYDAKHLALSELKQSILHKAFAGELTADPKSADRELSEAGV